MKKYTYYNEIRNIMANFTNAFDDVIIKRFNEQNDPVDQIAVNYYYAPKNRVLQDLVNKAGVTKLPAISIYINNIERDVNRVFNKIEGPYYTQSKSASGYDHLLQPVPVNISVEMNILTRFQRDLDQILSNFVPYNDPYIILSWKQPYTNLEIRSHVIWSGNISIQEPIDITHSEFYRQLTTTSFIIEGWLFKKPEDPIGKIYKIDTSFTSVSDIVNSWSIMHNLEDEYNTDTFIISARPQFVMCDPYITTPCMENSFTVYGKMFDWVTNLYAKDNAVCYSIPPSSMPVSAVSGHYLMWYDPAASNAKISAMYPGFSGVEIPNWTKHSDNVITFTLPQPVSAGYLDIIAFNEAGYGSLITDMTENYNQRSTFNPYPSTLPGYYTYTPYKHPSISGIYVVSNYDNC